MAEWFPSTNSQAQHELTGSDRHCGACDKPYRFSDSRAMRTLNWRRYCCPGCERGETFARAHGAKATP